MFKTLQLSMDKAVAHYFEPKAYPISRGDSFERLFLARFKELHAYKQQAARTKVMHRIKSAQTWHKAYYGRLAAVNLTSSISVASQVSQLPKVRQSVSMDGLAGYYRSLSAVRLRSSNGGSSRAGLASAAMSAMTLEESGVTDVAAAVKEYEKLQAISKKYKELGGEKGFLGAPVSEEHWAPDGQGRYRHYKNGSIYWHPDIGAFEVHGGIRQKWKTLGWEQLFGLSCDRRDGRAGRQGQVRQVSGRNSQVASRRRRVPRQPRPCQQALASNGKTALHRRDKRRRRQRGRRGRDGNRGHHS